METKPVKADPKAIFARQGHAHVDQKMLHRRKEAAKAWRRAHGLK